MCLVSPPSYGEYLLAGALQDKILKEKYLALTREISLNLHTIPQKDTNPNCDIIKGMVWGVLFDSLVSVQYRPA